MLLLLARVHRPAASEYTVHLQNEINHIILISFLTMHGKMGGNPFRCRVGGEEACVLIQSSLDVPQGSGIILNGAVIWTLSTGLTVELDRLPLPGSPGKS